MEPVDVCKFAAFFQGLELKEWLFWCRSIYCASTVQINISQSISLNKLISFSLKIYLPVENELCQYRKQFLDLFDKLGVQFIEDLFYVYDEVIKYNPPFTWSVRQSGPYVGCH